MISVEICTKIIKYHYRWNRSMYSIADKLNIDKKTVANYIEFIDPFTKHDRFDIQNDEIVNALAAYVIALKNTRSNTKTTSSSLVMLKSLMLALAPTDCGLTNIYNLIHNSIEYKSSDLALMGKSTLYEAIKIVREEIDL